MGLSNCLTFMERKSAMVAAASPPDPPPPCCPRSLWCFGGRPGPRPLLWGEAVVDFSFFNFLGCPLYVHSSSLSSEPSCSLSTAVGFCLKVYGQSSNQTLSSVMATYFLLAAIRVLLRPIPIHFSRWGANFWAPRAREQLGHKQSIFFLIAKGLFPNISIPFTSTISCFSYTLYGKSGKNVLQNRLCYILSLNFSCSIIIS